MKMVPTNEWRERTFFLEKQTRYVFSLELYLAFDRECSSLFSCDLRVRAQLPTRGDREAAAEAIPRTGQIPLQRDAAGAHTYHVLNEELTTTVDGAVHELPLMRLLDLQDWITLRGDGLLELDGRALLETDDQATISMLYDGVVRLDPETGTAGRVHLATRYEVDRPRYRWLTQSQLVGFGQAHLLPGAPAVRPQPGRSVLALSVDLYSAT
jgi:hypothetical protein